MHRQAGGAGKQGRGESLQSFKVLYVQSVYASGRKGEGLGH